MGKVRNQSPGEPADVDTDKLGLSLSICLNDIDAQVGSLEEAECTRNPGAYATAACRSLYSSKVNVSNKGKYA